MKKSAVENYGPKDACERWSRLLTERVVRMVKVQQDTSGVLSIRKLLSLGEKLLDLPEAYKKKLKNCCTKIARLT